MCVLQKKKDGSDEYDFVDERLTRYSFRAMFHDLMVAMGLPGDISLYAFRYASATMGIEATDDVELVSRRVGHASNEQTISVYFRNDKKIADEKYIGRMRGYIDKIGLCFFFLLLCLMLLCACRQRSTW